MMLLPKHASNQKIAVLPRKKTEKTHPKTVENANWGALLLGANPAMDCKDDSVNFLQDPGADTAASDSALLDITARLIGE
jgi:hypothetical protein